MKCQISPTISPDYSQTSSVYLDVNEAKFGARMLPPEAQKKMQCWIRSRHLICSGNFFIFETVDYSAVERFSECVIALGGTVISVDAADKVWIGDHRQVVLYRSKASLHTPHHQLNQYWIKYGNFRTRFDEQV
ncbi:CpeR family transcriptional regulator [Phormidium tenue]|nr:CpeR family transcriptional regulator [Phormidium tenue]